MAVVRAGSRVLLRTSGSMRVLRALADVRIEGDSWFIPVIGEVGAIGLDPAVAEVSTEEGALTVPAVLTGQGSAFGLRPAGPNESVPIQRRGDIRSPLELPVRAAFLPQGRIDGRPPSPGTTRAADLEGATINASASGIAAWLADTAELPSTVRLHLELDLPDGEPAAAIALVVEQRGRLMRARFEDITLRDRERLVRLVFTQHRLELAARAEQRGVFRD
jgi:hypothetical protein